MPIIRSPSNCRCSLWFPYECGSGSVLSRGRLRTLPPPHSYGNQRLQRQFDGLLMMDIIMPETCWVVSERQNNKILRSIVASSWVFCLSQRQNSAVYIIIHITMKENVNKIWGGINNTDYVTGDPTSQICHKLSTVLYQLGNFMSLGNFPFYSIIAEVLRLTDTLSKDCLLWKKMYV